MSLKALIFDVDGTLADTEEAHRQAFNAAFRQHGLAWDWSALRYRDLLRVAGGKERILHYIAGLGLPEEEAGRLRDLVPALHRAKTRRFAELVAVGEVVPRPGVARLLREARAAGLRLAIATTTSPANVAALLPRILGEAATSWFSVISAGDAVSRKKPAPDIYQDALMRLGMTAKGCVAFEDSDLGVRSAKAAGLFTVAVPTTWTADHDLSAADVLLPSLGDPESPLDPATRHGLGGRWLGLHQLERLHSASAFAGDTYGSVA